MIIGILEYGEVRIYESDRDAIAEWHSCPDDIGNVVVLYDESGDPLAPIVERRSFLSRRRLIGLVKSKDAGLEDPLWLALEEADHLKSNSCFKSLDEVRQKYPRQSEAK